MRVKNLTPEEEKLIKEMYEANVTTSAMSRKLKRSHGSLCNYLLRNGMVNLDYYRTTYADRIDTVVDLYVNEKLSLKKIAAKVGANEAMVYVILKYIAKVQIRSNTEHRKGLAVQNNDYTEQDKEKIIKLFKNGASIMQITRDTGKSHSGIRHFLTQEGLYKVKHRTPK